jgi:hypothetical protein
MLPGHQDQQYAASGDASMLKKGMALNREFCFDGDPGCREPSGTSIALGRLHLRATTVFDTYWKFACERQAIFLRRLEGTTPWTRDPILSTFRFTNPYRASDRVSQFLIREVAYKGEQSANELFFRIILFKLFNKIETWQLLTSEVGEPSYAEYSYHIYDCVLTKALESGLRIYSAAYIMPSGGRSGLDRKHQSHLLLLERMIREDVPGRISNMRRMADAFKLLRSYPMLGDFLAYQFVTDLNYSVLCDFGEDEFVVPGPGARDGIRKCFPELPMSKLAEVIEAVCEGQEEQFDRHGLDFKTLWGRRLQLIDCQNLFCEVDKYARMAHPDIAGISGRTRIKQSYRSRGVLPKLFFPPKWKINDQIPIAFRAADCNRNLVVDTEVAVPELALY